MALIAQEHTDRYSLYNGDCVEVLRDIPSASVHLNVNSPPFAGLYNYSSDDRDLSNCDSYDKFFEHYEYVVRECARVTMPGRINAIHCTDIPQPGQRDGYFDLPGRIIALHEAAGFHYFGRVMIWKEPLRVAIRTRLKHLTHKQLVKDSTESTVAAGDTLLIFKRRGENKVPVTHPTGFSVYAGAREVPPDLLRFVGETEQRENKLSHWIWRAYASCVWDDIRIDRVLPYKAAKEPEDEKHVHPLQLDVIDRAVQLYTNPEETVLTPFMGVGSEVYGAVYAGRRAIGVELKPSYFNQAKRNVGRAAEDGAAALAGVGRPMGDMFGEVAE